MPSIDAKDHPAWLSLLPNFDLDAQEDSEAILIHRGLSDFHQAVRYVHALPYGRTADRSDFRAVLTEQQGTCSTKHALLARMAQSHRASVTLLLAFYEMSEANTPGVGEVLDRHGLNAIPEAHCVLRAGEHVLDLTHPDRDPLKLPSLLHTESISPEQIGPYKVQLHRRLWQSAIHSDL